MSSSDTSYYVYALKDLRQSPAMPFYIGKGTGTRSHDHLVKPDETRKGLRIREIEAAGHQVLAVRMVEALSESQALKLEAELIAAFGTLDTGGLLTNAVMPSGLGGKSRAQVVVPSGAKERAQVGLSLLKQAVLEMAQANTHGVSNVEVASLLGLRSDYLGGAKDYLSHSLIGLLLREGKLERQTTSKRHVAKVR